jgi:hypothetical protein
MKKNLVFLFMFVVLCTIPSMVQADVRDRIFDFTDQYYAQNGIDVTKIFGRRQVTGNGASVFDVPNFSYQREVRASRLSPGYAANGQPVFWAVMGDLDNSSFLPNRAGQRARDIANSYVLYVFPTRTGNPIGLGNNRQADIVDTSGGYFSNDPLGLWLHVWVSYTDSAFNTKDGIRTLAQLQRDNGTALDGTPIVRTLSELNNLFSKGFAIKRFRNPDGSEGPFYGICPVIKDPRRDGIAVIDSLAQVQQPNGQPLEPEFLRQFDSLRLQGDWAN